MPMIGRAGTRFFRGRRRGNEARCALATVFDITDVILVERQQLLSRRGDRASFRYEMRVALFARRLRLLFTGGHRTWNRDPSAWGAERDPAPTPPGSYRPR